MIVLERVVVFDQSLYIGKGPVNRWITGVTAAFTAHAIEHAPLNKRANTGHGAPGGLKASIRGDVARVGERQLTGTVSVGASYAIYVLKGTTGPIYSNKGFRFAAGGDKRLSGPFKPHPTRKSLLQGKPGYFMALPSNPMFGSGKFHFAVSGQRANNFLITAYDATARTHRALHPIAPNFLT